MAILPCDYGRHRTPDKLAHLYPALLDGRSTRRRSLRACPRHAQAVLDSLASRRVEYGGDFDQVGLDFQTCLTCGREVVGDASSFFLTAYMPGQERIDYAGVTHRACPPPEWTMLPNA